MTGVLAEYAKMTLGADHRMLVIVSNAIDKVFASSLGTHADDPEAGPSISLLVSTMAALSESECKQWCEISF